ncbi:helix-turn-helix domain-containing protein [Ciceribacter sp. L1K23]|uniref:helix-turn-helix domain-containing protein n=1 Tax=Ciceribacter sp. L1K23 TaxID=2820276 RepID=UPI001B83B1E9|nr:helix-turn-helix domain-containing protein [Ciceribacter sp. L1K23]MBR0556585.1 helix-turn-helix domain-containing protein [Ciceribacter sp. L1K23]
MSLHDSLAGDRTRIPNFRFSTESIRQEDQFDAWCEFTSSMCDLEAITPPSQGFRASADSYRLGSLQLTSFELSPMNFRYTHDIVRRSGFDHWCISVVTQGPVGYESRDSEFKVPAGQLILHSYASPFSGVMDKTNYSGVFFTRDDFWDIADQLDRAAHQLVQGPMSQILRDFLVSIANRANHLTVGEASAVGDAFGQLMRAMIAGTPATLESAQAPIAAVQFDRARRHINANLRSPDLSADQICATIGVSRRQLYYLFAEQGGVATYIRNRRLAACYAALSKTSDGRLVSSIAYEYGFTNLSSFYRQFHARYGFSPTEARAAARSGAAPASADTGTFVDWLLRTEPA